MNQFYSKIVLLGEYTILSGSSAITIPYRKFSARLCFPDTGELNPEQKRSNAVLDDFCKYLMKNQNDKKFAINLPRFEKDIQMGLHLESSIPEKYGLGSSGALVAAVVNHYLPVNLKELNYTDLKQFLAGAESFFHGNSSGIDPFCIYLNEPLCFKGSAIKIIDSGSIKSLLNRFFLFDTGIQASTENLVAVYYGSLKSKKKKTLLKSYIRNVDSAVTKLIEGDTTGLYYAVSKISEFQYFYFQSMIPEKIRELWYKGIQTHDYIFKLCGSGGGGYVLVFSLKSRQKIEEIIGKKILPVLN